MQRAGTRGWAVAWAVWAKELREAVRDAHVLGFSIVFPILFFPLLIWGVSQILMLADGRMEAEPPRVMVDGGPLALDLAQALRTEGVVVLPAAVGPPGQVLDDGGVDAIVRVDENARLEVHHRSTSARAGPTVRAIRRAARARLTAEEAELAQSLGVEVHALAPPEVVRVDQAPEGRTAWSLLGRVLPGVALAALWLGAIYPAVEVVVGERERGTLETTRVTTPSAWGVVVGKLLAVLTLVLAGALGNLGAMALTVAHLFVTLGRPLGLAQPTVGGVVLGLVAVVLSAVVAASVLVAVASSARTLQQGQNMVALVATLGMAPGMAAALPALELTAHSAWIPMVNMALLLRAAVSGDAVGAVPVGVAVASSVGLCVVVLRLAGTLLIRGDAVRRWRWG